MKILKLSVVTAFVVALALASASRSAVESQTIQEAPTTDMNVLTDDLFNGLGARGAPIDECVGGPPLRRLPAAQHRHRRRHRPERRGRDAKHGSHAATLGRAHAPAADARRALVPELKEKLTRGATLTLIDLRSADAYAGSDGKIRGAIHIKERRLRARLALPPLRDVARDAAVVTYCACPDDEADARAAQTLSAAGFKRVRVLKGGWRAWLDARGQVEAKQ